MCVIRIGPEKHSSPFALVPVSRGDPSSRAPDNPSSHAAKPMPEAFPTDAGAQCLDFRDAASPTTETDTIWTEQRERSLGTQARTARSAQPADTPPPTVCAANSYIFCREAQAVPGPVRGLPRLPLSARRFSYNNAVSAIPTTLDV